MRARASAGAAVALLLVAGCAVTGPDTGERAQQSANETQKAAAREAWARHPMARCLAGHGYTTDALVTTRTDHERVSLSEWLFDGPVVSVARPDPYEVFTTVWRGGDRFEKHIAAPDTPFHRQISIQPWQRLGCDPEAHGITLVWRDPA